MAWPGESRFVYSYTNCLVKNRTAIICAPIFCTHLTKLFKEADKFILVNLISFTSLITYFQKETKGHYFPAQIWQPFRKPDKDLGRFLKINICRH